MALWAAVVVAWELSFRLVEWRSRVFPAPSTLARALAALASHETRHALLTALLVSGGRVAIGFLASLVIAVPFGVAMWRSPTVDRAIGGPALGLQSLPGVCWVPVAVLLFGLSEASVLFVVVMGSTFAGALALRDGLRTLPPTYEHAGRMLGASGYTLFRHVLLPASLPALTTTSRQAFSFTWCSLMGAELVFALRARGLGNLLHEGRELADVGQVVALVLVMVLAATAIDQVAFVRLERRVRARFGLDVPR